MSNCRINSRVVFGTNDQAGSVLVELIVAAIIFALVMASIAFYFVHHVGTMDNGRAQLKLQRVGSLLMEEMARALREGKITDLPDEGDSKLMITYPDSSTRCYLFDEINKDIQGGFDYDNLTPLETLDDSYVVGSETRTHRITCDALGFKKEGDRVTITFILKHDLDNGDAFDDLTISFGSTVKLRG
jgi:type II secretory pathway pseudopilin PulG